MTAITTEDLPHDEGVSPRLTFLLALTCGLVVANLYYAQPLTGPISQALGLPLDAAGLIVTMTQIGYVAGMLLIVPLADLVENRRLICGVIGIGALALLGAALSNNPAQFLAAALFIGIGSVSVQIVVPFAAHMAPDAIRGKVVGNVTTGLLLGVMLARPVASFITAATGAWHAVFFASTAVMVVLGAVLSRALPRRRPQAKLHYVALLRSMAQLALHSPVLQRRAAYQSLLFAAFSLFWTVSPLVLAAAPFNLTQRGIALFALAGVAGAVAAPIAGRLADRGHGRFATGAAMVIAAAAFLVSRVGGDGSTLALGMLVLAGIMIDFGVQANLVIGFRAIFGLAPEARGRLNALYLASFFAAGAVGSAVGGWAYARGGWSLAAWIGLALPAAALAVFATE